MKFNSVKFKRLYNGQTEPLKERIFFLCQWPFKVPQVMGILFVLSRELIFNARCSKFIVNFVSARMKDLADSSGKTML